MSTAAPVAAGLSAELRQLVESGVITAEQAVEASKAAPAPDEVEGFAQCMTPACPNAEALRPLRLRVTTMQTWAPDMPVVLSATTHLEVVEAGADCCSECHAPVAIMRERPPTYQRMI